MTVPTWAPLAPNPFGVWDVEPGWVADHAADVQLLDVREPDEFTGELGWRRPVHGDGCSGGDTADSPPGKKARKHAIAGA